MKRSISICILVFAAAVVAVVLLSNRGEPAPETNTELSSATEEAQSEETAPASTGAAYAYLLREQDGWVVVYRPESEEVYMETGIRVESLPAELKDRLPEGIGFADEAELFDFLESYAS